MKFKACPNARIALLLLLLLLSGCIGLGINDDPPVRKVAVVTLAVSNWRGVGIAGWIQSEAKTQIVQRATDAILGVSEEELGRRWEVVPARSFVAMPAFQSLRVAAKHRIFVPNVIDAALPVFTARIDELLKGEMDPARARALCAALKVDAVVAIFSDWTVKSSRGRFARTTKAYTKTVLTVWDAQGRNRGTERVDRLGEVGLDQGFFYIVSDETISEWIAAYRESLVEILRVI
jgi:hypothetical protein